MRQVTAAELPGGADLAWGSFPCQDLSLAGVGGGMSGERSGAFYPFWDVMGALRANGRAPRLIALENVCGTLTSHGRRDFQAIGQTFDENGYRFGALVINAGLFVPQSRPRLFLIGVREDVAIDSALVAPGPVAPFHTTSLRRAAEALPGPVRDRLVWRNLPTPERRARCFADEIEEKPHQHDLAQAGGNPPAVVADVAAEPG
ncbi:MAG TPA: DNA cytosine methyltransferase [Caulobacteraceae bacterium]